jgi:hypothetical protein
MLTVAANKYCKAETDVQSQICRSMIIKNISVGIPGYMLTVTTSRQMYGIMYILTNDHLRIYIHSAVYHNFKIRI